MDLSLLQFIAAGFLVRLGTSSFPAKYELLRKTIFNLLPSWEGAQIKSDEVQGVRWQCINCRSILIMKHINLTLRIKLSYMYTA